MAGTSPVVLILGAGANIGQSVARAFAAKGYKVAAAARKLRPEDSTDEQLNIQSDFENPASVEEAFKKTRETLGHPSVVVYNAATLHASTAADPLSLSVADLNKDLAVNTTSALAAAQEAVASFGQLPTSASRTFIYTGNRLNIAPMPALLSLGMTKSASASMVQAASESYGDRGFKFYYADERKADGSPAFKVDGPEHGDYYVKLAEGKEQGPWLATFVKGKGYTKFH